MEMTKLSCEKFLTELASKAPTPGGGGTAALGGAAGVALGNMVGNLTTGKKKYAATFKDGGTSFYGAFCRARTYNPAVNSRMLYH